jgi:hypothetical protein
MLFVYTKVNVIQRLLIVGTYVRKKHCREFNGKFIS